MKDHERRQPEEREHAPESARAPSGLLDSLADRLGPAGTRRAIQRRLSQRKAAREADVQAAADRGTSGAGGALPYVETIQRSFGRHDVSGVKAHTDGAAADGAAAMGAEAFASGDHVAFAGPPSLHTAAHEAAHVVQQRAGVHLKGGVGAEGDTYEHHADAVADLVVAGKSAEAALDRHAGAGGSTQAVQRKVTKVTGNKGTDEAEHKNDVAARSSNFELRGAYFKNSPKRNELLSADGMSEEVDHAQGGHPDNEKLLTLNEQFEIRLGHNLEQDATGIAKKMSETVGGYQTHEGAHDYIHKNLASKKRDVEKQKDEKEEDQRYDFSETTLGADLPRKFPDVPAVGSYKPGAATLPDIRANIGFLKAFKGSVDKNPDQSLKEHYRKIFYTLKLQEMLLSQMGYFGGSLEFKAGMEDDLEYWVYLLSTKTRNPEQQMTAPAPKPMAAYETSKDSLLPWNNQFSMSIGHAEFESADSIPAKQRAEIEEKLGAFQGDVKNVGRLDALAQPKVKAGAKWTLKELIAALDENKRKTLYTDLLRLSWSEKDYQHWAKENPFVGHPEERKKLEQADVKDPRVMEEAERGNTDPREQLMHTYKRAHVTGRKANILLTPESASYMFQKKLAAMSVDDLKRLYGDRLGGAEDKDEIIAAVTKDAEDKVRDWQVQAKLAHKPMYAGPSGHTLGYLNLYRDAYDADEEKGAKVKDKPNLEKARLVMLASLIGNKEHHSYDEVLVASQGIATKANPGGGNKLSYKFRSCYADMTHAKTDEISDKAAKKAKDEVSAAYRDKQEFASVMAHWADMVI